MHEHVPLGGPSAYCAAKVGLGLRSSAYCAAKVGLGLLTKVMALELAEHGIAVNAVAPGSRRC